MGCRVWGAGFLSGLVVVRHERVSGFGFRVSGFGFHFSGFGFQVWGEGSRSLRGRAVLGLRASHVGFPTLCQGLRCREVGDVGCYGLGKFGIQGVMV